MTQPLLPTQEVIPLTAKETVVEICFKGNHCDTFAARNFLCIAAPGAWTVMNAGFTAALGDDIVDALKFMSWGGIISSTIQVATGVFHQNVHRPFNQPIDRFPWLNYGNMLMGTTLLAANVGLLLLQETLGSS